MVRELRPGAYDELIDAALAEALSRTAERHHVDSATIEPADAPRYMARHVERLLSRALSAVSGDSPEAHARRVQVANEVLAALEAAVARAEVRSVLDAGDARIEAPPRRLLALRPRDSLVTNAALERPETPLSQSALLVNAPDEPSLGSELRREIACADHVDLLCAFLKWSGLRFVQDRLADLVRRGGRLRVITTTYIGASDLRAIDELAALGGQVRISFDTRRTRLHAKAWLFHRDTGTHTAYIGSSNLSRPALHEGLEWNVRLAERDAGTLLAKFRGAFDSYWESAEFEPYDPERDRDRVDRALRGERESGGLTSLLSFDLRPHPYQEQILEALRLERTRGHHRNLVVAPTGAGKTLVAAFDFERLRRELPRDRLLFVAHRERILEQSRAAYRHVLREGSFGELYGGGERPVIGEYVFATVQSLARLDLGAIDPSRFDVVVVDEFHHAEAPTYERLLAHLRPVVLLGLTATPERHDGRDVRRWFDGRTAYEMRLWEALEQGLLSPFQYFGVHDGTDLSHVEWRRAGYDLAELGRLYTGDDRRVELVLAEVRRRVTDPRRMRALGFCVTVEHARFMARRFAEAGLASEAITGESARELRDHAIERLERGELQAIFTVDLFNEGVDIPRVDTVLFLRPTESATVFLQQLGRGLRLHREKPCLTVLDFIGNARREFRFDRRFRALLGGTTRQVQRHIEAGFPYLPPGCAMHLDRVASERVLENIRQGIGSGKRWLAQELRALGPEVRLSEFLREAGVSLDEVYSNRRSFASLRSDAFGGPALDETTRRMHARLGALTHVTDVERLDLLRRFAQEAAPPVVATLPERERRLLFMLAAVVGDCTAISGLEPTISGLWNQPSIREELLQLLDVLEDERREATTPWIDRARIRPTPLHVHGHYRQEEVLAALHVLRDGRLPRLQSGVFFIEEENIDLLFVTLRKTESGFSPSTMYHDYAISPTHFHWESQNTAHPDSAAGRRYLDRSSTVLLFIREHQKQENGLAEPYLFAGPARLKEASGARPMQIVWELEAPLPASVYHRATLAAG